MGYVDWGFWITYIIIVSMGGTAGWWLRGVKEQEDEREAVWRSKMHHPAYRWMWEDERGGRGAER